jgi:hypothetical protein
VPNQERSVVLETLDLTEKQLKARLEMPPLISEKELAEISAEVRNQIVLLDIRQRPEYSIGHSLASINIPVDELEARAQIELDKSQIIIIDCLDVPYASCTLARSRMLREGFSRVSVLNRKPASPPCGTCPS